MQIARLSDKLRRFSALSLADQWLFGRAVVRLAVARLQLAITPFEQLARRLSAEGETVSTEADPELVRRVGFAVAAAANNVPWRSDCFPQTIAARKLLERYGYASTIHLGVERSGEDGILGHAWLTCGGIVVTGGQNLDRYVEIHRLG